MILLPNIKFRPHQLDMYKQFKKLRKKLLDDYKSGKIDAGMTTTVCSLHRRAGKDIFAFSLMVKEAFDNPGLYMITLPTIKQAKKIYFDGVLHDGRRVLDIIPKELVIKVDRKEGIITMKTKNGSVSTIMFTNNDYNTLVGTAVKGMILSEFAVAPSRILDYMSQAIKGELGWVIVISTPRGKANAFYKLYKAQENNPYGMTQMLDITQTVKENGRPIFTWEDILKDIEAGLIQDEETAQQEYMCNWDGSNSNSFYKVQLKVLEESGRDVDGFFDPNERIYISIDYGVSDKCVLTVGQYHKATRQIHILEIYNNNYQELQHYIDYIKRREFEEKWRDIVIVSPHDGDRKNMISFETIDDILRKHFKVHSLKVIPDKIEGIEMVRKNLINCHFRLGTQDMLDHLKTYQKTFNKQTNEFTEVPIHNESSNFADSFRYLIRGIEELEIQNRQITSQSYAQPIRRAYVQYPRKKSFRY